MRGYVGVPREEKGPLPAVIFNRGGNRAFSVLRPQVICKYAAQGFVVLGSQYRGNCGGTGQEEFGGADVNDVLRLIDIALELPGTFKGGVYMAGHSRGGMMTYRCCALDDRIVAAAVGSGTNFLTSLMNVVILAAGGYCVYRGVINVGDMVAYMLFINMFVNPIKKLIQFVEMFQNAITGYVRFQELMNVKPEQDEKGAIELKDVRGEIVFDDVTFHYDENKEVLSHISLTFPQGKMVAIVGPSGGGKTTLCHLIPRFYEISGGSILVDGHDIRDVTRASLRRQIGIVQQDVFLFTGTIFDNIAYGKLGASREEVYEAAKKANIHDYIMSLPEGYDTFVGERGVKLSGGQKQRISIARVFLKNPPILVLDEATSALDNVTENYIQDSLDELCKNRTTIVVAHRLSTIKNADEIIVMDRDGIEERGTHEELLARGNGIYKELYEAQFARI